MTLPHGALGWTAVIVVFPDHTHFFISGFTLKFCNFGVQNKLADDTTDDDSSMAVIFQHYIFNTFTAIHD